MFQQQSRNTVSRSTGNFNPAFRQYTPAGKSNSYMNHLQQTIGNRKTMELLSPESNSVIQRAGGKNTTEEQDKYLADLKEEVETVAKSYDSGHNLAKGKLNYDVHQLGATKPKYYDTGVYKSGDSPYSPGFKPKKNHFNYAAFAKQNYPTQIRDSEVQIFQEIDDQLVKDSGVENFLKITGELTLVSTKGSCTSCQMVARKFKDRWPDIVIDINYINEPEVVHRDDEANTVLHYGEEEDREDRNKATGMYHYRVESTAAYNERMRIKKEKQQQEKKEKANTKQSQIETIQKQIPEWITEGEVAKFKQSIPFLYLNGLGSNEKAIQFIDYLKLMHDNSALFPKLQWIKGKNFNFEAMKGNFK